MPDYLFQHFYSTLAIIAFLLATLILHHYSKRGREWIPVRAAPSGCLAFVILLTVLTFLASCLFSAIRTGETWEEAVFMLARLLALAGALAVISRLTNYYMRRDGIKDTLNPGESASWLAYRLRNRGICLFLLIGVIIFIIDFFTISLPVPELPPGSPFLISTPVPLLEENAPEVRISSRVTNRFFGESDFDLVVRDANGSRHVFPSILINPGGASAITIYRLRPAGDRKDSSLIFTNEIQICLLNLATMQVKMLRGSSSNYPSAEPEDLHGPDIENRLEIIGLYRGHSCIPGVEYTQETRAKLLKNLQEVE